MTEDTASRVSSDETQTRQRRKRKWDQPAESLLAVAGVPVPGAGPMVPTIAPVPPALIHNGVAVPGGSATAPQVFLSPPLPVPQAVDAKLNQPKPQPQEDLIIAREIVINDAEATIRYKLTKRQTQEEIQNCTGAVVITRGKYRPPNAPADGEKPLYLHISAGAHLKEIAERIIAVDHAAAMVEEMLKQGPNAQLSSFHPILSNGTKVTQALSTTVYLGFDVDPSLNIAARIRGPNDQYINHIMNETGATVLLRGHGSGALLDHEEESQQPLHLLLSSNNPKSLEDARRLAEHLLDTISVEFGVSRVSSHKVYGTIPPPEQLANTHNSVNVAKRDPALKEADGPFVAPAVSLIVTPAISSGSSVGPVAQSGIVLTSGYTQSTVHYTQPALSGGTSYRGYEGIYPQATPLQQVALALRHSPFVTSTVAPVTAASSSASTSSTSSDSEKEKRPPQKRKFQELPLNHSGPARIQGLEVLRSKAAGATAVDGSDVASFPTPKKMAPPSSNGMLPPPKSMPPPPPPPKFCSSSKPVNEEPDKRNGIKEKAHDPVPDTLVKLMEYGDDDFDDPDDTSGEPLDSKYTAMPVRKPFWAV